MKTIIDNILNDSDQVAWWSSCLHQEGKDCIITYTIQYYHYDCAICNHEICADHCDDIEKKKRFIKFDLKYIPELHLLQDEVL